MQVDPSRTEKKMLKEIKEFKEKLYPEELSYFQKWVYKEAKKIKKQLEKEDKNGNKHKNGNKQNQNKRTL